MVSRSSTSGNCCRTGRGSMTRFDVGELVEPVPRCAGLAEDRVVQVR